MPDLNSFLGLSGLGLTPPSTSGNVDNAAQGDTLLQQLLAKGNPTSMLDETGKSEVLQKAISQLQGTKSPTLKDELLSKRGLASLAIALGAGAAGGAPAAVGAAMGGLQGASDASILAESQKRKAIAELTDQNDKLQSRIIDQQKNVATMFNTNPEAFVDPKTGQQTISPEVLGYYATGQQIPIFASTRRQLNQFDKNKEQAYNLLTDRLKTASPDDAKKIIQSTFTLLNYKAPDDLVDSMARGAAAGDKWTPEVLDQYFRFAGETAMDAFHSATQNGWGPFDPRVVSQLQFRDPDASSHKLTPSDRALQLAQEINDWQQDPANLETLRKITMGSKSAEDKSVKIAQEVLGGREGDLRTYLHEQGLHDPTDWAMLMNNYNAVQNKFKLGIGISGIDQLPMFRSMTPDQQTQWLWQQAQNATDAQRQSMADDQAKQTVAQVNSVAERLGKELKLAPNVAGKTAADIAQLALNNSTSPDGRVDYNRFAQELKKLTDEAIAETNKQ
jgi:hypothetical protein